MLNSFDENNRTLLCVKSNMDVFLIWNCNIKHAMKTNLLWFTWFTQLCNFQITANIYLIMYIASDMINYLHPAKPNNRIPFNKIGNKI